MQEKKTSTRSWTCELNEGCSFQEIQCSLCRLVNETCVIALVQAGTQANQFASMNDCTET